jgi:hypothetical protein
VVLGEGHLFAALWEGKGGSQAARHCISGCYDTLLELLKAGNEPSTALQKAFKQLDESYLASDLPDVVSSATRQEHTSYCPAESVEQLLLALAAPGSLGVKYQSANV